MQAKTKSASLYPVIMCVCWQRPSLMTLVSAWMVESVAVDSVLSIVALCGHFAVARPSASLS